MCRLTKRKISSRSAAATFEGEFSDLTRDRHLSILGRRYAIWSIAMPQCIIRDWPGKCGVRPD
jgi:hypothetical protein